MGRKPTQGFFRRFVRELEVGDPWSARGELVQRLKNAESRNELPDDVNDRPTFVNSWCSPHNQTSRDAAIELFKQYAMERKS